MPSDYIKTNTCASLSSSSLDSLLHVKITGLALQEYLIEQMKKVVEFWCNAKNQCRQNKNKQKKYKEHSSTENKGVCFDINAINLSDSDNSCSSSTSSSGDEVENETTKDSSF